MGHASDLAYQVSVNRDMEHFTGNFDIGTDSDGRFLFVSLPPDVDYYIYGGMDSFKKLGAIPLKTIHAGKDGEVTDIGDLVVGPAHRLAGRVVLADGAEIPTKTRLLVSRENAWDNMQVTLPPDGHFDVSGVPAETMGLSVRLSGYRVSAKNASLDRMNPFQLIGRMNGDVTNLVFLMEKGSDLTPEYGSNSSETDWPRNKLCAARKLAWTIRINWPSPGASRISRRAKCFAHFNVIPGRSDLTWNRTAGMPKIRRREATAPSLSMWTRNGRNRFWKIQADGYLLRPALLRPWNRRTQTLSLSGEAGPTGQVVTTIGQPVAKAVTCF